MNGGDSNMIYRKSKSILMIIKKLTCVLVCSLLSFNAFAAAVSDNDGTAFITKPEFDSLKSEFQSELNGYNANIDSKITDAISSYLAGLKVSKEPGVLYTSVQSSLGSNLRFLNNFATEWTIGTSTDTPSVAAVHQRSYRYKKNASSLEWNDCLWMLSKNWGTGLNWYFNEDDVSKCVKLTDVNLFSWNRAGSAPYDMRWKKIAFAPDFKNLGNKYNFIVGFPKTLSNNEYAHYNSEGGYWNLMAGFSKTSINNGSGQTWNYIAMIKFYNYMYVYGGTSESGYSSSAYRPSNIQGGASGEGCFWSNLSAWDNYFLESGIWDNLKTYNSTSKPFAIATTKDLNYKYMLFYIGSFQAGTTRYYLGSKPSNTIPSVFSAPAYSVQIATDLKSQSGAGKGWRYRNLPNGNKAITTYDTSLYPSMTLSLKYHSYIDKSSSAASSGSYSDTTARSQTLNNNPTIGVTSGGTDHGPSSGSTGGYWQQILSLTDVASPVVFETAQWGDDLSGNLYMVPEKGYTFARNGTMATTLTNGPSISWSDDGFDHTATAPTNDTYTMKLNRESLAKTSFENSYLSAVAGETVYVGGGCPIVLLESEDKITVTMDFLAKSKADAGTLVNGAVINYKISDKQFTAGNFSSGARNIASGTVTTNSSGTAQVTFDTEALPKGTKLWISAYASTKPQVVELTNVTARLKTS